MTSKTGRRAATRTLTAPSRGSTFGPASLRDRAGSGLRGRCRSETAVHGRAGRVANGIDTVHRSYVRARTGHALIGAREWIPQEHTEDPGKSLAMGCRARGVAKVHAIRLAWETAAA